METKKNAAVGPHQRKGLELKFLPNGLHTRVGKSLVTRSSVENVAYCRAAICRRYWHGNWLISLFAHRKNHSFTRISCYPAAFLGDMTHSVESIHPFYGQLYSNCLFLHFPPAHRPAN